MSLPPAALEPQRPAPTMPAAQWFDEEVRPHESKLRAWLRSKFPSLADLDDIVQESYLRVLRAWDAGKVRQTKPYLFTTARNAALDFCRHEKTVPTESMADMGELHVLATSPDSFEAATRDEELGLLSEAIESLPTRCRQILVLRKLHGLSQREIADRLGLTENTVAAQASIGMRRCVAYFRERNFTR